MSDKLLHWPQLTIIALLFIGLGINIAKDGQSMEGEKYSFVRAFVRRVIMIILLWAGGFFS